MARSRAVRAGVWAGGLLLCALVLLIALLHTPPVKKYALKQLIVVLEAQGVHVDASGISYNLLSLNAGLGKTVIRSTRTPDLPPIFEADSVSASVSLTELIRGKYHIRSATVVNPRVHLVIAADGRDNIPKPPEKKEKTKTDFLVEQFVSSGGELRMEDRARRIAARLPMDRLVVTGNTITRNHDIDFKSGAPGRFSFESRNITIEGVSAAVLVKDDGADIRRFEARVGESTVAFSGQLSSFTDPRFDVSGQAGLSLASIAKLAGVTQTVEGIVQVKLQAKGPIGQLTARATIEGRGLTLDRFQRLDLKSEVEYDAAKSRMQVASLNVVSSLGAVNGKADIALNTTAGTSTANFAAMNLDLSRLSTMFQLAVQVASRASGKVAAHWPALTFEKAAGDATVQLAATRDTAAQNVIPVSGSLNAKTEGQRIVVGIPSLQAMNVETAGQVVIENRQTLSGELDLKAVDVAAAISSVEAFLGREPGTLLGTPVAGALTAKTTVAGAVKSPSVSANISSSNLSAGDLKDLTLSVAGNYNPGQVTIGKAAIGWQNEEVTASGTVGLTGSDPQLTLAAQGNDIRIASILRGLNHADVEVTGLASFTAKVGGTARKPQVDVRLSAKDLIAYNETIGSLRAQGTVQDQLVRVTDLQIEKPHSEGSGSLTAQGTYHLQTSEYTLNAIGRNLRLSNLTFPGGKPLHGQVEFTADGKGKISDPAANIQLAVTNLEVEGRKYGAASATAQVANKNATIEAAAPGYHLTAKGNVATVSPYAATFEVNAEDTDLASLPVELDERLKGVVSAKVTGSGPLADPEKLQANAEVAALNITWNGQPIRSEGPLKGSYANQRLTIDSATVIAGASRVTAQGTLPLDPAGVAGEITLSAKLDLPSLVPYIPSVKPILLRGTAAVDGTISGTLKHIDPTLTIALDNGFLGLADFNPPVRDAMIRAKVANGVLELKAATAELGPASFAASGTVPLALLPAALPVELPRGQGPAQFTADLKELDLETVEGVPSQVGGIVSAHLEASASKPDLEAVTGKLTFPRLNLTAGKYALEQKGTSEIAIANGIASVQTFDLIGPATNLKVSGTAGFTGTRPLNLNVDGSTNASVISAFTETVRADGNTTIKVAVTGTAEKPLAKGYAELAEGTLSLREPRLEAEDLSFRVDFDGDRATVSKLEGSLNGGAISGNGSIDFSSGTQALIADLNVKAEDVFLDYPEGLKTTSNVELRVRPVRDRLVIGGQVVILEGGFTDDLNFDRGILASLTAPRPLNFAEQRNPFLQRLSFDLGIRTDSPIVVKNNLARAEVSADLRLLGTPYEPGMSGRLTIEEGGELRLQERKYTVDRGIITFTNDRRIEPGLDILATTAVDGYDITLRVSGDPGETETTLTSDPSLPEPDILALLLTGKQMEEMRGREVEVARNQMLSYLTGRVGSSVGRQISGVTGLSTVRIEPNLIAAETDPSARLTVGQNITRNLQLVYSMDLVNSSDQIYVAEYAITRRFNTRGTRQSDGSYRFDFRHELRFGGTPEARRGAREDQRRIGKMALLGERYFPDPIITDKLNVRSGDRYDFLKVRKGVDNLSKKYESERLLESSLRLKRDQHDNLVDLSLAIKAGPVVDFTFEGISVPNNVQKQVHEIWHSSAFDRQRIEDATETLRQWLVKEDYFQAEIENEITTPAGNRKRVLFTIHPGAKFQNVQVVFDGATAIKEEKLRGVIKDQKLSMDVYTAPGRVIELLTRFYQEQGYLDATVQNPRYELNAQAHSGKVIFPLKEGPLYKVGDVRFEGNTVYTAEELAEEIPLPKDEGFRPVLRQNALDRLRGLYWDKGYNDVEPEFILQRNQKSGIADITFKITEHGKGVVKEIVIEGNSKVSQSLIRSQLRLKEGDVLDLRKVSESRRNLYNIGAFGLVDITREEMGEPDGARDREMRLRVKVRELQPFQLRYGGFYDTERGPGGIADIYNRNSLGGARLIGLRTRYDSQLHEGRLYFSQPVLGKYPLETIVSPFIRQERHPGTAESDPYNVDRIGFSVQQQAVFDHKKYLLNYGYRIERSRTYDPVPGPFDVTRRVAALTSSFTRETRDDVLDATKGSLMSHAFEFSPETLGSELRFVKYFGQYFKYFALQKPRVELFTNRILRPRLVYAAGARAGLARTFGGQELPLSERFFAGGGTTIRGFEQDSVGPAIFDRVPEGGQAMLVLNNELRFPLFWILDGVGFVDVGNVYPKVSDFRFTDLRKAGGVGLRVRTPWFLIRADYGVKLDRRTGESFGRLFVSIGQAF